VLSGISDWEGTAQSGQGEGISWLGRSARTGAWRARYRSWVKHDILSASSPLSSFSTRQRPGVPFCVGTGSPEACPSEKRFPHRPTQKGSQTRAKFVIRPLQGRTDRWVSIRGRRAQKACPCPRLLNLNPFGVRNRFVSSRLAHPRCSAEDSEHAQPRDRGLQFASRLNPES